VRSAFLLILSLAALPAANLKIDHVTVAGADVKRMQAALKSIGIDTVYGGPHSNHASEMALTSFPDGSYLEVMGIQPNADAAAVASHEWVKFLKGDAGPCAWALREPDLAAEVARLKSAGVPVSGPAKSGRQRPDGVKLEWQTSNIGDQIRGTFFPFLIQDLTPRDQRVYPQGRPVTRDFRGVARVVIAVRNLEEAVKRYRQAFGLPEPIKQVDAEFGAQLAMLGGSPVVLAAPLNRDSWLTDRLDRFGESPCAFILSAVDPKKWKAKSKSRWFGAEVGWLDAGWRLGIEAAR
jgi:hypothetical protein